jgi:oxazoline/thiazoline dehydrogenase
MLAHAFSLRFRPGVSIARDSANHVRITLGDLRVDRPDTPESRRLFETLSTAGAPSTPDVFGKEPFGAWTAFNLPLLEALGLVEYEVLNDGRCALALEPTAAAARPAWRSLGAGERVKASRFAQMRIEGGRAFIETPLAAARIVIRDAALSALWALLASPRTTQECSTAFTRWDEDTVRGSLELLLAARVADVADDGGAIGEERNPALRLWSPHELMFHARSREGRHDLPYGAWSMPADRIAQPAARRACYEAAPIALPEPPADLARTCSTTLLKAIEIRRSVREWNEENPVGIDRIAYLLDLSVRVKAATNRPNKAPYEPVFRPVPSAGAMGELEVYLLADRCAALPAGAYHYDSYGHRLFLLPGEDLHRKDLLEGIRKAMGATRPPQAALIVSARHPRMFWKYSSIGYSLELKNVGVLFQMWYLLAAALGIGACAAGCGNSDVFSRLTGADYYDESSIGEFALGSLPPTPNR